MLLVCWWSVSGQILAARPPVRADSLRQLLAISRPDTNRVNLLILLAWNQTDYDPLTAITYGQQSRRLAHELGFQRGECRSLLMLGWAFLRSGNYPTAVQSQVEARRLAEQIHYRGGLGHADNGLGFAHLEQESPRLALQFFFRAMRQAEAIPDSALLTPILGNIGYAYLRLGQLDSARYYTERGYELDLQQHDWHSEIGDLALLGDIAARQGQELTAQTYYRRAISRARGMPVAYALCQAWLGLARLARQHGQLEATLAYARRGLQISQTGGYTKGVLDASTYLAGQYAALGDSSRAYAHLRRATAVRDSLFSLNRRVQVEALSFSEQLRRQALIEAGERAAARRRQQFLLGALVVLATAAAGGYLILSRRHLRRVAGLALERQRLERSYTAEMLQIEEKERRRVGADLHDGVGQLLSAAHMNLAALRQRLPLPEPLHRELLTTAIATVSESVREIRSISHGLTPVALLEYGLPRALREQLARLNQSGAGLVATLHLLGPAEPRLELTLETVVFRIAQEALQNVVKHAQATEVSVTLERTNQALTLRVHDNGRGFDAAAADHNGLGMHNLRRRARYLNARLHLESAVRCGTTLTLVVPLTAAG
ncbi:ATP-binding protein [Hymenobacter sp. NST-14]|uniref:tetratricopeptide repeat-containing sensor histidine kinase n=1 Tax=Hymenobacter piscis TaxID=2839984 RepID=UPI001C011BE6|nr:ATP-binding protein [Hymenobacter piscis]MBT9392530.1 ATP-binding protein [Hymenobacter piscis]